LFKALKDEDDNVSFAAINALGDIGPPAKEVMPDLVGLLKKHINDKLPWRRLALARAIVLIEPETEKLFPYLGQHDSPRGMPRPPGTPGGRLTPPGVNPPGVPGGMFPGSMYPPDNLETWQRAAEALKKRYGDDKR
jgi:hypothetical protein